MAGGHTWQGGCIPGWCTCDLSHNAFDVTCMLSPHQLRVNTNAAAYTAGPLHAGIHNPPRTE